jgi:hypothetical protein
MTPKKPSQPALTRAPDAPIDEPDAPIDEPDGPIDERPAGFVEDAPAAIDDDESVWAAEHAERADADNPALAEARKRVRALLDSKAETKR